MENAHSRPLWVGLVACATIVPVTMFLMFLAIGGGDRLESLASMVLVALAITTAATVAVGLPLVLLLRRAGVLVAPVVLLAGAFAGAAATLVLTRGVVTAVALAGAQSGLISAVALCVGAGIPWRMRHTRVTARGA
jgi:hypothetical protein